MSTVPLNRGTIETKGKSFSFPDFEISWTTKDPLGNFYYFGSEDGRLRIVSAADSSRPFTHQFDSLRESINGIAIHGDRIAASTRCEVIYLELNRHKGGRATRVFEGGARGVTATPAGRFLAPLGVDGLLTIIPSDTGDASMAITKLRDRELDFYQIDYLTASGEKDCLALAARRDGMAGLMLSEGGNNTSEGQGQSFGAPALDIIDVCSLRSPGWPMAMAGLGSDRSIHFCRDIFGDQPPQELRLEGMQGAAYSILSDQQHLLVHTSKFLYSFPWIVRRFFDGDVIKGAVEAYQMEIEAVDVHWADDELFLILADRAVVLPASELTSNRTAPDVTPIALPRGPLRTNWRPASDFAITEPAAVA